MQKLSPFLIGLALLGLSACSVGNNAVTDNTNANQSSSEEIQETKNVMYRGLLEEAGSSIFMQGTHKLQLSDGRFVMLESDAVNLDHYVGKDVEVFGAVRPTVEEGGMIMRVESVKALDEASSSSASSDLSSASGSSLSSQDSSMSSNTSSVIADVTSSAASSAMQQSSAPAWEASDELTAKANQMAKDNLAPANWTQQYCSSQINFCIPVHRNWWFKSFGTTSSALWHVEIGPSEMNNLGEGPITVRLLSGASPTTDGDVQVNGGTVTGYRSWTENRYIEIRGPAVLEAAIRYLTAQLKASTAQ